MRFAHGRGYDLTLIETMPLGEVEADRTDQYLPLSDRARAPHGPLDAARHPDHRTGGPARYVEVAETGGLLGFITPMTHNFCESCNRVRLTCTGTLYMCLGQEDAVDLRAPLREGESDADLHAAIDTRHAAEAQGPRLRHRPPRQQAVRRPAYERDGRVDLPPSVILGFMPRTARLAGARSRVKSGVSLAPDGTLF